MVNLGFTIGTITDYMHGYNGQKGLCSFSLENTVEVLAPDLFGTLHCEECPFDHLACVRVCSTPYVLWNLPSVVSLGFPLTLLNSIRICWKSDFTVGCAVGIWQMCPGKKAHYQNQYLLLREESCPACGLGAREDSALQKWICPRNEKHP